MIRALTRSGNRCRPPPVFFCTALRARKNRLAMPAGYEFASCVYLCASSGQSAKRVLTRQSQLVCHEPVRKWYRGFSVIVNPMASPAVP